MKWNERKSSFIFFQAFSFFSNTFAPFMQKIEDQKYSQLQAMWAITRASLRALFRSPSTVVFGFAFPFVFILVFGFMGNNSGRVVYKVAVDNQSDTANDLYRALLKNESVQLKFYSDTAQIFDALQQGKIAGVIHIEKNPKGDPPYLFSFRSASSAGNQWPQFKSLAESVIDQVSDQHYPDRKVYADFSFDSKRDIAQIREYKTIDFILPGQLGFSLLASGVFGVAFVFFSLRNTLVLKRFFATPITRTFIIMGEMLSRVLFQMLTAFVIILMGKYLFGFTLIHGVVTFINLLILSFIGLFVFMGFGFIISGIAKNEGTIPPLANIITLPQFLIGGTFFPIDVFPKWLQWIANVMPLTHLNNALRDVAFEGNNLWDVRWEIVILLAWGIVVYGISVKVFKWE